MRVYQWKAYDIKSDKEIISKRFGTVDAIKNIEKNERGEARCIPVIETEQEVDDKLIDENGFLIK